VQIDARPSDSIAIALRLSAPIYAAEELLTGLELAEADEGDGEGEGEGPTYDSPPAVPPGLSSTGDMSAEQLKAYLEHLRPEDFGKFNP
jgi:bifunctional DNase/RNase